MFHQKSCGPVLTTLQKYRRRDLRNGLASRIGTRETPYRDLDPRRSKKESGIETERPASKKRARILNIPLEVSDYTIEDMVKEIAKPIYSNFYDHKEGRTAVFEFEDPASIEEIIKTLNGKEMGNQSLVVESFESQRRQDRRAQRRGNHGSRRGGREPKKEKAEKPTVDQLDAELEAYMNN